MKQIVKRVLVDFALVALLHWLNVIGAQRMESHRGSTRFPHRHTCRLAGHVHHATRPAAPDSELTRPDAIAPEILEPRTPVRSPRISMGAVGLEPTRPYGQRILNP
jgi:hypothetical protein